MNLDHMTPMKRPDLQSIDDLENHLRSLCDDLGFIETKKLNMLNPEFLHYEDALEILNWTLIQRGFYGSSSN